VVNPRVHPAIVAFASLLAAVLGIALAGIAVASLRLGRRQPRLVRELWLRYFSWLVLAAVALGALALGRGAWIALVTLLSLAAFREFARGAGLSRDPGSGALVCAGIVLIDACAWWPSASERGWYGLFMAMPAYATAAILAVPVLRDRGEDAMQSVGRSLLGLICFGWMLGHLAFLVNLPQGVGLVLLLIFLVSVHDVAAFVIGKLAGRHPLRPALSPRKTWEGAAGALVVVIVVAQGLGWLVPEATRLERLGLGLLVGASATLGDLALSALKRDVGIKDWGTLLPGHGGVLDRVNSLIIAAPVCFHYARSVLG
jgi:phosphatidate cytidylyltransferase